MANRFYIYNYCWENFVHYDIKKDNETNEFVQDGDPTSMMYHKIGFDRFELEVIFKYCQYYIGVVPV